ncbi:MULTISPECIES: response regulator transcription factor [Enterococcus]|uniref:response regulator transcription factor n=1 Tax=Enterococcus TaxID=1350 RepID=UPI00379354A9
MKYKMLIVEDENFEKEALETIISKKYNEISIVGLATSGKEAVNKAKLFRPDIILMDIGIPELDGLSAQRQILDFLPDVRTIILTAYSDFQHAQDAINSRVVDYLIKPIRTKKLTESIDRILLDFQNNSNHVSYGVNELSQISQNETIQQALIYIENHYLENIQITELAKSLFLNPQYFSRLFKKELNISFSEFLILYKLEKSKDLLIETDLPIYAIANNSGFTDSSYYCKTFKKYVHVSPLQFRKRNKGSVSFS